VPEKSGIEVVLRVSLSAGPADGSAACIQAGVEIADTMIIDRRKSRGRLFMLRSRELAVLIRQNLIWEL
jgi:hypothetical protein